MHDTGMFAWFSYDLPLETRLELIKNAGFAATALYWGFEEKDAGIAMAHRLGLAVDTVHAPFAFNPSALWAQEDEGERYLAALCDCVRSCAYYGAETGSSISTVCIYTHRHRPWAYAYRTPCLPGRSPGGPACF